MGKKKRIYCTVTNDLSYDQRMQRICSSLAEAGYEVILVGRLLKKSKPLAAQNFHQKRIRCWFNKGKLFYAEYNIRLFFFLIFLRWDAICSVDLDTLLTGSWLCYFRQKPCIYDAHEYFTELPELVERPGTRKIWAWVARRCIPKVAVAYTVCESLADIFQKEYGTSFSTIRNVPMALPAPEITPQESPYILLYQGMINDGRGIKQLLEAMVSFSADKLQLWLVGEGDLYAEMQDLAHQLELEDRVRFWGFVAPAELKTITQQAHIGLNLLENKGLNYYYSLANKFFDYVQAGKPSINMAFPEYQRHNAEFEVALLIDKLAVEPLVAQLQALVENRELYARLHAACLQARQVWIWEKEKHKLITTYNELFGLSY